MHLFPQVWYHKCGNKTYYTFSLMNKLMFAASHKANNSQHQANYDTLIQTLSTGNSSKG